MNRQKVADSIHASLDAGIELLGKKEFEPVDHAKVKTLRTLGSHVNAAVAMVQQETAQQRIEVVKERMKQLGYGKPLGIEG
jgi:hypothetical protein